MPHERLKPNFTFNEDRVNELKKIVPESFADGKINWETLKESLGEYLEGEEDENGKSVEHFGLFWPGKREARQIASIPSQGTLVPVYGGGLKADGTLDDDDFNDSKNIFIEGENLEILKILQKSYAGRIKMIYIDPPYNTGNDLVYDDNFTEPLQEYLRRTGQIDEEGKPLTTNKKADGRFHSRWLSMMYPRLKLARNLLSEDGVIFVSIDDNEVHNIRSLMNEIFGEENFMGVFIVQSNPRGSQSVKNLAIVHEYIIAFSRDLEKNPQFGLNLNEKMKAEYKYEDDNGKYRLLGLRQRGGAWRRTERPYLYYPFYINQGTNEFSLEKIEGFTIEVFPIQPTSGIEGSWRWSKEKSLKEKEKIVIKKITRDSEVAFDVYQKDYLDQEGREKKTKPKTIWNEKQLNYQNGTTELKKLFEGKDVFSFPKPVYLIKKLIAILNVDDNDIVLDYFAGSGTTGHAVIEFNEDHNSDISFINIQLPEEVNYSDQSIKFRNLSEASFARLKKVVQKSKTYCGIKYFKLTTSNFRPIGNYLGNNVNDLDNFFKKTISPLVTSWTKEDLLSEIMILEGFPLDSNIEIMDSFRTNKIFKIYSEFCEHNLLVCLEEKITQETINHLTFNMDGIFICLDAAISDQEKMRMSDKGIIKTI